MTTIILLLHLLVSLKDYPKFKVYLQQTLLIYNMLGDFPIRESHKYRAEIIGKIIFFEESDVIQGIISGCNWTNDNPNTFIKNLVELKDNHEIALKF